MTSEEWRTSDDPAAMLKHLRAGYAGIRRGVSDRKLRLFACALLAASDRDLIRAGGATFDYGEEGEKIAADVLSSVVRDWCVTQNAYDPPRSVKAALLREIVGDPFHPVTLPPGPPVRCRRCEGDGWNPSDDGWGARDKCEVCGGKGTLPLFGPSPWLTPDVTSLARATYDECLPDGTLDPVRLTVLSDALEEAGCDDGRLLLHLRGADARESGSDGLTSGAACVPPPHVRGCWVLDLLLGEE